MIPDGANTQMAYCYEFAVGETTMRGLNLLFVLIVNAIPLIGVMHYGWSAVTVIVLYWCENLLVAVFTTARIALHRTLTRKRGHWRGGQVGIAVNGRLLRSGLLGEYATMAFVFTLAHGVFVGAFVLMAGDKHAGDPLWMVSGEQLRQGVQWMSAVMAVEFLIDAATMRARDFAWIRTYVGQRTGRVLVMHLAIIFGMGGMMFFESPFAMLYVLIGLKTLWELFASGSSMQAAAMPAEPPAWVRRLVAAVDKDKGGAALSEKWAQDRAAMVRAASEDEEVMPV